MLAFDKLSYWEKKTYFEQIDFLIIGSGIVGLSTALSLREQDKNCRILILERGYLPTGASTKNAGFTCFGSPSELLDDIHHYGIEKVTETLKLRFNGLEKLKSRINLSAINYQQCGSYELFTSNDQLSYNSCVNQINFLNQLVERTTGLTNCYSLPEKPFNQLSSAPIQSIFNQYEGQLDTGLLMSELTKLAITHNIHILNSIEVNRIISDQVVRVETNYGDIVAQKVLLCTNGLTQMLYPNIPIQPARAQVIVTSPIPNLTLDSTYHYDKGYYYFRVVDNNRILIGGARNADFKGEQTLEIENTTFILSKIIDLLKHTIIPNTDFTIDYQWAGIMGIGQEKKPMITELEQNIFCAIGLGGMGVAMGSEVGTILAHKVIQKA